MKTSLIALTVAALCLATTAHATPTSSPGGYGTYWEVSYQQLGPSEWEYAYDIYAEGDFNYYDYLALKFDFGNTGTVTDHITNLYDTGGVPELREFWTVNGMYGNRGGHWYWGGLETGVQASFGDLDTNSWVLSPTEAEAFAERWFIDPVYAAAEGMANPFHDPLDYARWAGNGSTQGDAAFGLFAGQPGDLTGYGGSYYTPEATHLMFDMTWFLGGHMYGGSYGYELMATIRIVSDLGPYGEVTCQFYSSATSTIGAIVGPGAGISGFTPDDIDLLCAAIGSTDPGDLAMYDLDEDGDIDVDDQYIAVTTLLEYDLNGDDVPDGLGTFLADFNTDGSVDLADLTILRTNSGLTGQGFADGDTNCDGTVDLADLTTLRGLSGSSVSGVPEPASAALLLLGGIGLFRRRNSR